MFSFRNFGVDFPGDANWKMVADCIRRYEAFCNVFFIRGVSMVDKRRGGLLNASSIFYKL